MALSPLTFPGTPDILITHTACDLVDMLQAPYLFVKVKSEINVS